MKIQDWNIEKITGYKPLTTFYMDFSIADRFGTSAIKDTFKRAFKYWKHDYKYITELYMVMNWKMWYFYETNEVYAKIYYEFQEYLENWIEENFNDEEKHYFYRITD